MQEPCLHMARWTIQISINIIQKVQNIHQNEREIKDTYPPEVRNRPWITFIRVEQYIIPPDG